MNEKKTPTAVSVFSIISSVFLFFHTNISYIPTITGMVTIDNSVVSTYNELAYAASLSYSCAMDVTVAQAGVMDAIYTVRRICLESFSPVNVYKYWINNQSQYCRNIISFFSKHSLKRYIRNNHSGKQHTDRTNHIVHHIHDILHA